MNRNYRDDDAPIFSQATSEHEKLSIQELEVREANKRKNKILNFGTKYIIFVVCLSLALVFADFLLQKWQMERTLINECFSLLKYSITTILGFMFANNNS